MRTEGKWFKRSYLCLQPGEIAALPRHLGTVWYALEPHAHGGQIDTSQTAKALRQAFGSDLRGYVGDVLAPPLVQAGWLRQEQRRFLRLIPYQTLERTPAGEARVRPMLRLLEEAKGIRKLLRDDPDRALSLAQAAGIMLVLSPQARAAIPKLKQLLADHSGGDAHVSSDAGWNPAMAVAGTATEVAEATRPLVDEPRHDVAIAAADLHLRPRVQNQEAFAVGVRLHLSD
jgi:hypothetical protein